MKCQQEHGVGFMICRTFQYGGIFSTSKLQSKVAGPTIPRQRASTPIEIIKGSELTLQLAFVKSGDPPAHVAIHQPPPVERTDVKEKKQK